MRKGNTAGNEPVRAEPDELVLGGLYADEIGDGTRVFILPVRLGGYEQPSFFSGDLAGAPSGHRNQFPRAMQLNMFTGGM